MRETYVRWDMYIWHCESNGVVVDHPIWRTLRDFKTDAKWTKVDDSLSQRLLYFLKSD
jgi:hypothetical protein